MSRTKQKFSIDKDTGVDHSDSGPWRSYQLCTEGNTREELLADAWIFEVDQDGGELRGYALEDARADVQARAQKMICDEASA